MSVAACISCVALSVFAQSSPEPIWIGVSPQPGSGYGTTAVGVGDVNGDGLDDIGVTAPNYAGGLSAEGAAFVYHFSASGPGASHDWKFESNQEGARLDRIARAGDVNDDGFGDVLVSASMFDVNAGSDAGRAWLFLGGPAGLASTAAWTFSGSERFAELGPVAAAGDVDGDGFADILVSERSRALLFHGSAAGPSLTPDEIIIPLFPGTNGVSSIASAGDVDADGFADVLVSLEENGGLGGVYFYLGSPSGLPSTPGWVFSSGKGGQFGYFARGLGDVDGDGYDDVSIVGNELDCRRCGPSILKLAHGGPHGLSDTRDVEMALAAAGDVDGDGIADVSDERSRVYLGSQDGPVLDRPAWLTDVEGLLSAAGDIDGDGLDDVVLASNSNSSSPTEEVRVHGQLCLERTIDDAGPGITFRGSWALSGSTGSFAGASRWARRGSSTAIVPTARFRATLAPGEYGVLEWHSVWSARTRSARHVIEHAGGTAVRIVDQSVRGGQWNFLGTFNFAGTAQVTIHADDISRSTNADAIRFVCKLPELPVAKIDSAPSVLTVGEEACFSGHGEARVPIVAHEWTFGRKGRSGSIRPTASFCELLSAGDYTYSFRVQDSFGVWAAPVSRDFQVVTCEVEVAVDDSSPSTSRKGNWNVSAAPGSFQGTSRWAKPTVNFLTFSFDAVLPRGTYEVSEWHSVWSTRTRSARHVVTHSDGTTASIVDQSVKGGQWNVLGRFRFDGAARVTIFAEDKTRSTNADAVRFRCTGAP